MVSLDGTQRTVQILQATLPGAPVPVYFLENAEFFGRYRQLYLGQEERDEQRRFILSCRGLLESLPALDFLPDILHLNDWQTAPCAAYLRTSHRPLLRRTPSTGAMRIIYTIHNLQYQGRWDPTILEEAGLDRSRVFVPDGLEYWGDLTLHTG